MPGFRVGSGLTEQARCYSDITNANFVPSYFVANAYLGYEREHWRLDFNVHNITNRRYYLAANAAGVEEGEPLSALVILHANF